MRSRTSSSYYSIALILPSSNPSSLSSQRTTVRSVPTDTCDKVQVPINEALWQVKIFDISRSSCPFSPFACECGRRCGCRSELQKIIHQICCATPRGSSGKEVSKQIALHAQKEFGGQQMKMIIKDGARIYQCYQKSGAFKVLIAASLPYERGSTSSNRSSEEWPENDLQPIHFTLVAYFVLLSRLLLHWRDPLVSHRFPIRNQH